MDERPDLARAFGRLHGPANPLDKVRGIGGLVLDLTRCYPSQVAVSAALLSFAALAEVAGLALVFPLLTVLLDGEMFRVPALLQDSLLWLGGHAGLNICLLVIVVAFALKAVLLTRAMVRVGNLAIDVAEQLRLELLNAVYRSGWAGPGSLPAGEAAAVIGVGAERSAALVVQLAQFAARALQVFALLSLASIMQWWLGPLAALTGGVIVLLLSRFTRAARTAGAAETKWTQSFYTQLVSGLQGMKTLKAMGAERWSLDVLRGGVTGLARSQRAGVRQAELVRRIPEPLAVGAIALFLLVMVGEGAGELGALLTVVVVLARCVQGLSALQGLYLGLAAGDSAHRAVERYLARSRQHEEPECAGVPGPLKTAIELDRISYAYGARQVLDHASLSVPAGTLTVLTGTSGAGKTTALDLLGGLLTARDGALKVDGHRLDASELVAWRGVVGYVPHDVPFFAGTIYENLVLGSSERTIKEVQESLRLAAVLDVVERLNRGLDEPVGPGGYDFSAGERQRLGLARALLRKPTLLLLDEVSASLDESTERLVCANIRDQLGRTPGLTIVAASHRAMWSEFADEVYRLEMGRFARTGR